MKRLPKIISHINSSVDGRLVADRWTLPFNGNDIEDVLSVYTEIKDGYSADAWILGRNSVQKHFFSETFDNGTFTSATTFQTYIGHRDSKRSLVIFDSKGLIRYTDDKVYGDNIIAVLGENVSEEYLEFLRQKGISYLFAGADGYDYEKALHILYDEFAMRLVLLDGGGMLNGLFLKKQLIDELSLVIYPGIDALSGISSIYEYKGKDCEYPAYGQSLELMDMKQCRDGVIWLKYKIHKKDNNHE